MRLWTLHPKYLDARGLVAVWREGLLAQAVLRGDTRGYTKHPQLHRFRLADSPRASIARYLDEVYAEARRRGYRFDRERIRSRAPAPRMRVTAGQVRYEWRHFRSKLAARDRTWLAGWSDVKEPDAHPLFRV